MVNDALKEELNGQVHALSIQAKTIDQWNSNPNMHRTPNCSGGHK